MFSSPISTKTLWVSRVIQGGIHHQTPPNLLRRDFTGLPRSAEVVLFDRIGDRVETEMDPRLVEGLATALHGSREEADAVIDLWRTYRSGKIQPLFAQKEWNARRGVLMRNLREKLAVTVYSPGQTTFLLEGAPPLILETFHNVVIGTGRDIPHISQLNLERKLFPGENKFRAKQIQAWENFWEEIATLKNWKTKPYVVGPQILCSGMLYAEAATWDLQKFHGWLLQTFRGKPEYAHALIMFEAVIDTQVLYHKREKPRPRPTIPQLLKKARISMSYESKFLASGKNWEAFAKKLGGAHVVRPRKPNAVRLSERRAAGKLREDLFATAAENMESGRKLHRRLLEAGLISDAAAAANILIGLNDNPRKPTRALSVPDYHPESLVRAESRVETLAIRYGFGVKPKLPDSDNRGKSRRIGDLFREIASDEKSIVSPLTYLEAILSNLEIGKAFGEKRLAAFEKLFLLWNDWQKTELPPSKLSLMKGVALEYNLSVFSMHTWWRLFDRWSQRFSWHS